MQVFFKLNFEARRGNCERKLETDFPIDCVVAPLDDSQINLFMSDFAGICSTASLADSWLQQLMTCGHLV